MLRTIALALLVGALAAGAGVASSAAGSPTGSAVVVLVVGALAAGGALALEGRRAAAGRRSMEALRGQSGQREEILQTVVDGAPMAILLLEGVGRVVYANATARELLFEGRPLEGTNFVKMLDQAPAPFRQAFLGEEDVLFTVEGEEPETYHLSKRHFERAEREQTLIMVELLTRELRRQEVDVWKKLIRVISHELNNSLAPISSLAHSARAMVDRPDQLPKLARVFDTIEERARHLGEFLASYSQFARLPAPRRVRASWAALLERVAGLAPWAKIGRGPDRPGWFDASQLEQVIVNLLKNAEESGGPPEEVTLEVEDEERAAVLRVSDRGPGMTDEVLGRALLPFYSTKERGTGIGLPLCREIVEAHGGQLRIQNREGGGLVVTCTLPHPDSTLARSRARLTLTRA